MQALRGWTEERQIELVQIPRGDQPTVAPAGEVDGCDLIVALGGDGTVLKALHAAADARAPVLGVACGSLGALTTVPEDELPSGLNRFAAGAWTAQEVPALEVRADEDHVGWAINDFVVVRRAGTQLSLDAYVASELYVRLAGDGMVVATPLGSSAYSMAAGGALLTPETRAFICTPLEMHGGCGPPLVVPGDREVTLQVHPGHGGFRTEIDGFELVTGAERFGLRPVGAYATLVDLDDSRTGLPWLRARGLIADSPRVLATRGPVVATRTADADNPPSVDGGR